MQMRADALIHCHHQGHKLMAQGASYTCSELIAKPYRRAPQWNCLTSVSPPMTSSVACPTWQTCLLVLYFSREQKIVSIATQKKELKKFRTFFNLLNWAKRILSFARKTSLVATDWLTARPTDQTSFDGDLFGIVSYSGRLRLLVRRYFVLTTTCVVLDP